MDKKHTPGPWEVSKIGNNYDQYMIFDSNNKRICGAIEGEANAELISYAPTLLAGNIRLKEALEGIFKIYDLGIGNAHISIALAEAIDNARAALKGE
jgi:hypothetical protein